MSIAPQHPATSACTDAIVRAALDGAGEADLLALLCARLGDAGVAVFRASIATNLLDPTFDARGVTWRLFRAGAARAHEPSPG